MEAIALDAETVAFRVEDTGVGIAEEHIQNLFSTFTKIKQNRDMNLYGCGLGLSIS